jgi:hypothetical protein
VSWRGGVSAVDMYALAKHSPLFLRRVFSWPGKTSCSNARAVFAAGSHHLPRWLWGLLRQARLSQSGQHSEFTSVLAARAQGQENAGVLRAEGKLLHRIECVGAIQGCERGTMRLMTAANRGSPRSVSNAGSTRIIMIMAEGSSMALSSH